MGCDSNCGAYALKVIKHPINAPIDRTADQVLYNHLPMGSFHPGGAQFLLADGSVRFLPDIMDFDTYQAMATCNGRETEFFAVQ